MKNSKVLMVVALYFSVMIGLAYAYDLTHTWEEVDQATAVGIAIHAADGCIESDGAGGITGSGAECGAGTGGGSTELDMDLADLTCSGITTQASVGTATVGSLLYVVNNKVYAAADNSSPSRRAVALACEAGTGLVEVLLQGFFRNDNFTMTFNEPLFLGDTSGKIISEGQLPTTPGTIVQIVGVALNSDIIHFTPSLYFNENK